MEEKKRPVGRPTVKQKRKTYAFRLSDEVIEWIKNQPVSQGKVIEKLVLAEKNKQSEMDI